MNREFYEKQAKKTVSVLKSAGIAVTAEEEKRIEVADFGLGMPDKIGLQILTYVNTERVCAKEMVLFAHQACPEHKHVQGVENGVAYAGKEETFRVRKGTCYLYVAGAGDAESICCALPPTNVTVFHEIVLHAGEQHTIYPDTLHWFCAGDEDTIISEFSTKSRDESDIFTDARIVRIPQIEDEKEQKC